MNRRGFLKTLLGATIAVCMPKNKALGEYDTLLVPKEAPDSGTTIPKGAYTFQIDITYSDENGVGGVARHISKAGFIDKEITFALALPCKDVEYAIEQQIKAFYEIESDGFMAFKRQIT